MTACRSRISWHLGMIYDQPEMNGSLLDACGSTSFTFPHPLFLAKSTRSSVSWIFSVQPSQGAPHSLTVISQKFVQRGRTKEYQKGLKNAEIQSSYAPERVVFCCCWERFLMRLALDWMVFAYGAHGSARTHACAGYLSRSIYLSSRLPMQYEHVQKS